MKFNEDARVKIPTILHLTRLGYKYLSLKEHKWDIESNIFPEIFLESVSRINPSFEKDDIQRELQDLKLTLDNDDLGKVFFSKLVNRSGIKLIDFENINNNTFNVVTELTRQNGDDEFRPDITILVNGMPLVFIEVKKPNNKDGVLAERDRINKRFQNSKFKRFINITQFMIFSNNMEYDDEAIQPIMGAFYATPSYYKPSFNYFREEEIFNLTHLLSSLAESEEIRILKDNNFEVIRNSPEFITNKDPNRPTNRICTSLLSRERLAFMLRYSIAYVETENGVQKHIMRYPQLFATKAIERKLDEGIRKGIIWHTQGSGKTALTYYNVKFLTDYYQRKNVIPKFYFIVDRLDLLQQAQSEFASRGLVVHTINSRDEFTKDIKATKVIHNNSGKPEITVINIQKFADDPTIVSTNDYSVDIQRIYFLDEVHRSYNPKGSFLANLDVSDRNAIKIGLTGTPLLGTDYNSRSLFGDYIHKYYYNASIADGYTLRLIREDIQTNYKIALQEALAQAEVKQGDVDKKIIYAHPTFVESMLDYIVQDFENSRGACNDSTIGGMVICDSSEQAKQMFEIFNAKYKKDNDVTKTDTSYTEHLKEKNKVKSAALILHDVGDKQERKDWIDAFKAGKIDFLFVYNMLLTGFDAPRLKKLYIGRVIREHNLLQALTRVNRTYKDFRYGYVVDFADIRKEFDATNKAYFEELQAELGDEMDSYSHLFKSKEEIDKEINQLKDLLFRFDTDNIEHFSEQIQQIADRKKVLELKKSLADAKSLYNIMRLQGDYEQLRSLDFAKINIMFRETSNHLDMLNLKVSIESGEDTTNLLNLALEDVIFKFKKIAEEELVLADQLKDTLRKTREALASNFDQQDEKFISLKEELERLFKKKKLSEVTQQEMVANIGTLQQIHERIKELNRANKQLSDKYKGDIKFTRVHKRLHEQGDISQSERQIYEALIRLKQDADERVLDSENVLDNEAYFARVMMPNIIKRFKNEQNIALNPTTTRYINKLVVNEYLKEFNGGSGQW